MDAHLLYISNNIVQTGEQGGSSVRHLIFWCKLRTVIVCMTFVTPPRSLSFLTIPTNPHTLSRKNTTAILSHRRRPTKCSDDPPGSGEGQTTLVAQYDGKELKSCQVLNNDIVHPRQIPKVFDIPCFADNDFGPRERFRRRLKLPAELIFA